MASQVEKLQLFQDKVSKSLQCAICVGVVKNPSLADCGHYFCKKCITDCIAKNGRRKTLCPVCDAQITNKTLRDSPKLAQIVSTLASFMANVCEEGGFDKDVLAKTGILKPVAPVEHVTLVQPKLNAVENIRPVLSAEKCSGEKKVEQWLKTVDPSNIDSEDSAQIAAYTVDENILLKTHHPAAASIFPSTMGATSESPALKKGVRSYSNRRKMKATDVRSSFSNSGRRKVRDSTTEQPSDDLSILQAQQNCAAEPMDIIDGMISFDIPKETSTPHTTKTTKRIPGNTTCGMQPTSTPLASKTTRRTSSRLPSNRKMIPPKPPAHILVEDDETDPCEKETVYLQPGVEAMDLEPANPVATKDDGMNHFVDISLVPAGKHADPLNAEDDRMEVEDAQEPERAQVTDPLDTSDLVEGSNLPCIPEAEKLYDEETVPLNQPNKGQDELSTSRLTFCIDSETQDLLALSAASKKKSSTQNLFPPGAPRQPDAVLKEKDSTQNVLPSDSVRQPDAVLKEKNSVQNVLPAVHQPDAVLKEKNCAQNLIPVVAAGRPNEEADADQNTIRKRICFYRKTCLSQRTKFYRKGRTAFNLLGRLESTTSSTRPPVDAADVTSLNVKQTKSTQTDVASYMMAAVQTTGSLAGNVQSGSETVASVSVQHPDGQVRASCFEETIPHAHVKRTLDGSDDEDLRNPKRKRIDGADVVDLCSGAESASVVTGRTSTQSTVAAQVAAKVSVATQDEDALEDVIVVIPESGSVGAQDSRLAVVESDVQVIPESEDLVKNVIDESDAESDDDMFDATPDRVRNAPTEDEAEEEPVKLTKKEKVFVCSGLDVIMSRKVREFALAIGAQLVASYCDRVTHVIVRADSDGCTQRTLKYLYGVADRKWIVKFEWVTDALKKGSAPSEESYEVFDMEGAPGPFRARTSRTPLFGEFEFCCIAPFADVTVEQLRQLLEMCGAETCENAGSVTKSRRYSLIIVQSVEETDRWMTRDFLRRYGMVTVTREWVLDCIAAYTLFPVQSYLVDEISGPQLIKLGLSEL